MKTIKVTRKNVNNEQLCKTIYDVVYSALSGMWIKWSVENQRNSFINALEECLGEIADDGKITQYKIVCDRRNNDSFESDYVNLDIEYRQKHCLNVTQMRFSVMNSNNNKK